MKNRFILAFCGICLAVLFSSPVYGEAVATVKEASKNVKIMRDAKVSTVSGAQDLMAGDIIWTGPQGSAKIEHSSGFVSSLGPNSVVYVTDTAFDLSGLVLARGLADTQGEPKVKVRIFRVVTPVGIVGVRGTGFIVVGADSGMSLVGVRQGAVTAGLGGDVVAVSPGQKIEGRLASGFASPVSGSVSVKEATAWRAEQDQAVSGRANEVLDELDRLQRQEAEDWKEIERQIGEVTRRTAGHVIAEDDRHFFRRVLDIEDRMSARRLLAIDLRESSGVTPSEEAASERGRVQKEWAARNWRRRTWEGVSAGRAAAGEMPENLKQYAERMQKDIDRTPEKAPETAPVLSASKSLFPDIVQGVYLGMTVEELQKIRPRAKTDTPPEMLKASGVPVVYTEKELSGADWSKEGWFTAMYSFHNGTMVQGAFLAFAGTDKLRRDLLQKYTGAFGKPYRSRLEPDWAQPGVNKGSTVEWKAADTEVILISRIVPTVKGNVRGLELRIRTAGFNSILDNAGQFSDEVTGLDEQLKKDFPEFMK